MSKTQVGQLDYLKEFYVKDLIPCKLILTEMGN